MAELFDTLMLYLILIIFLISLFFSGKKKKSKDVTNKTTYKKKDVNEYYAPINNNKGNTRKCEVKISKTSNKKIIYDKNNKILEDKKKDRYISYVEKDCNNFINYQNNIINNYLNQNIDDNKKGKDNKKKDQALYDYMSQIPNNKKRRIAVLDIEICGTGQDTRILEICAREMFDGKLTQKIFHKFFKPKNKMSEKSKKTHKVPKEAYELTPEKEKEIMRQFLKFTQNKIIITHNATFDMASINKELEINGFNIIDKTKFRCSMRIFKEQYKQISDGLKLQNLCDYFNIDYNKKQLHRADYDSLLLGQIMEKIYNDINNNNQNLEENDETNLAEIEEENNDKNEDKKNENFLGRKRKNIF